MGSHQECPEEAVGCHARFRAHVAFWDNLVWSTQLLLWTQTRSPVYQARMRAFLDDWRLGRTARARAC